MELVESERFFRRAHCGSFHFPTTVEEDVIRIGGSRAGPTEMSRVHHRDSYAVLDDNHPIDFCGRPACGCADCTAAARPQDSPRQRTLRRRPTSERTC